MTDPCGVKVFFWLNNMRYIQDGRLDVLDIQLRNALAALPQLALVDVAVADMPMRREISGQTP